VCTTVGAKSHAITLLHSSNFMVCNTQLIGMSAFQPSIGKVYKDCRNTDRWNYILKIGPNVGISRWHRYNGEIPNSIKGGLLITWKGSWRNGLKDKRGKTNYLTTKVNKSQPKHFQVESFNFETVQSSTYLGSLINGNNDNSAEIKKRILLANKVLYELKRQFRSHILCSTTFFRKSCRLWDNVEKCDRVRQATDDCA